jgi:glucokinase
LVNSHWTDRTEWTRGITKEVIMSDAYAGIEIGGTKLQVAVGDAQGRLQERWRATVDRKRGAAGIRAQVAMIWSELAERWKPVAAGIGFGGPVNWDTGRIAQSYQVEGWDDFAIVDWCEELTGIAVAVDNDANVGALGEACCGAGRGCARVFYVTLGSGMGGGMVIERRIYHGALPGESEVGLMPFSPDGDTVESHCCGWAVDQMVQDQIGQRPGGMLAKLAAGATQGQARYLSAALAQGDADAEAILAALTRNLAFALSLPAHLFHPDCIVIGGGLSLLGEPLRAAVAQLLPEYMTAALKPGPDVRLAALAEDAVTAGAVLLAVTAAGRGACAIGSGQDRHNGRNGRGVQ